MIIRYSEGIDLLYSTNIFRIDDTLTLRYLPSLVLPERLARIKAITLNWALPPPTHPHFSVHAQKEYDSIWEVLASKYPGLCKLRVSLMAFRGPYRGEKSLDEFNQIWLKPLDKLMSQNLKMFTVYAPAPLYHCFRDLSMAGRGYSIVETTEIRSPCGVYEGYFPMWIN
jgi:hypothetical protein